MTQTEMEQFLENIDQRLARVEQKLPTLASKDDLGRFATKDDLERFRAEAFERFATRHDLTRAFEDAKRYALMLNESTRADVRIVAEGVAAISAQLTSLTARFEQKGVI